MTVRRSLAVVGMVLAAVSAQACVHAGQGDVSVKQALSTSLSSYHSASVESNVPDGVTNAEKMRKQLNDGLTTRLQAKGIFGEVPMSGGELTVRVNVTSVDEGNKALQVKGGGNAFVHTTVELYDTKESKVVGSFDVTGNSKQNGTVRINGVDTRSMGDTTMTACDAVSDQIVDYLDHHRGNTVGTATASASSDDAKLQATFTESGQAAPAPSPSPSPTLASAPPPAAPTATMPAGANTAPPPAPAATASSPNSCPLVCFVANKGRAAQADEQRLAGELSGVLSALRSCGNGRDSLTMRFDSGATLTEFGVDAERGTEGACVDAIREQRPAVTYAGPATLRCSERCGGDPATTTTRRRRAR